MGGLIATLFSGLDLESRADFTALCGSVAAVETSKSVVVTKW